MLRSDRYNRNSVCVRVCLWMPARGKFNVVRGAVLMEAQAQQNADDGSTYLKAGGAGEGLGRGGQGSFSRSQGQSCKRGGACSRSVLGGSCEIQWQRLVHYQL